MKVLIATPVYDETVSVQYFNSFLSTISAFIANRVEFAVRTDSRAAIQVSRSRAAQHAIEGGFDKIVFIDADIFWTGEDVIKLLRSEKEIVGGAYPLRGFPIQLNLVPLKSRIEPGVPTNVREYAGQYAEKTGEVEVDRIATGFLKIDISALKKLSLKAQEYFWKDPLKTKDLSKEKMFFPMEIDEQGNFLTEDWAFCELAKKEGYKIFWHTHVVVDHVGRFVFSAKG